MIYLILNEVESMSIHERQVNLSQILVHFEMDFDRRKLIPLKFYL
jgi:hypothetical protein